jgi:hypothetical protein
MEFNFSFTRLLLLAALIALFAWLGGFSQPSVGRNGPFDSHRVSKAWNYCVLMFLAGAVSVSIVDHYVVGALDRTNLRLVYVLLGVVLMAGGLLWLHSLQVMVTTVTHSR